MILFLAEYVLMQLENKPRDDHQHDHQKRPLNEVHDVNQKLPELRIVSIHSIPTISIGELLRLRPRVIILAFKAPPLYAFSLSI